MTLKYDSEKHTSAKISPTRAALAWCFTSQTSSVWICADERRCSATFWCEWRVCSIIHNLTGANFPKVLFFLDQQIWSIRRDQTWVYGRTFTGVILYFCAKYCAFFCVITSRNVENGPMSRWWGILYKHPNQMVTQINTKISWLCEQWTNREQTSNS